MRNPNGEQHRQIAHVAKAQPGLLEWLKEWRMQELERLPMALGNTAIAQGRCQVLSELVKLIEDSPNTLAKP